MGGSNYNSGGSIENIPDCFTHYQKRSLSLKQGKLLSPDDLKGVQIPENIRKLVTPDFRLWVPPSVVEATQGKEFNPKTIIFCDVHGLPGEERYLGYHADMAAVFQRFFDAGLADPKGDKFLFEPIGAYHLFAPIGKKLCVYGTVPREAYNKKKGTKTHLRIMPFNNYADKDMFWIDIDYRNVFSRLFETFQEAAQEMGENTPHVEFIDSEEVDEYHRIGIKGEQTAEDCFATINAVYAFSKAKGAKIAEHSGEDHMTLAVIGLADMFMIDFDGLKKDGETLEHICLIPAKECGN